MIEFAGSHVVAAGDEIDIVHWRSQHGILARCEIVMDDLLGGAAAGNNIMADDLHVAARHVLLLGMTVERYLLFGSAIGGADAGHLGFSHILSIRLHGRQCHEQDDESDVESGHGSSFYYLALNAFSMSSLVSRESSSSLMLRLAARRLACCSTARSKMLRT